MEIFSDPCLLPTKGETQQTDIQFPNKALWTQPTFMTLRLTSLYQCSFPGKTCSFQHFLTPDNALLDSLLPPYFSLSFGAHLPCPFSPKALLISLMGWGPSLLQSLGTRYVAFSPGFYPTLLTVDRFQSRVLGPRSS